MYRLSKDYKRAVDKIWGRMAKIRSLGQKPRFRAKKKRSHLGSNNVLATTGKSCANKKGTLFRTKYQAFCKFWVSFLEKNGFSAKKHFLAERKNGSFSVIPAGPILLLLWVIFCCWRGRSHQVALTTVQN